MSEQPDEHLDTADAAVIEALRRLGADATPAPANFVNDMMAQVRQTRRASKPAAPPATKRRQASSWEAVQAWARKIRDAWWFAPLPALAPAALVLAIVWPMVQGLRADIAGLRGTAETTADEGMAGGLSLAGVHADVADLKKRVAQQNDASIRMVESLAQQSFEQGRYTDALTLYLTNAGRESDRAEFYYTRAAMAAWHACDYQMAKEILEGRINENAKDPFMRFALGTTYQSLGDLDRAEEQYRMVTQFGQGTNVERAWFNLATVQAARFGRSHEVTHSKNALDSLNKSMDSARTISATQIKERVETIGKAMIPLADRPVHACSEGYHATQNLRPLSEVPAMQRWVKQPKSFDISGSQLTVR